MSSNKKSEYEPDQRQDHRTSMKCQVKMTHPLIGDVLVYTRDISDSGIFLLTDNVDVEIPPIGSIVQAQVQGMGEVAPILEMEIVRLEPAGIGLKFVK